MFEKNKVIRILKVRFSVPPATFQGLNWQGWLVAPPWTEETNIPNNTKFVGRATLDSRGKILAICLSKGDIPNQFSLLQTH